jgi:GNAT superfamily N-acetyltransferase
MAFRIEPALLADIPAMHAVRLAVRENRLNDPARVTERSYVRYVEAGSAWVAAGPDRTILGFVAADRGEASVWALFVHPDHEGTGVGKALHETLLDWARCQDLGRLRLTTAPGTRAEQFYLAAGWNKAGTSDSGELRFERPVRSAQLGA